MNADSDLLSCRETCLNLPTLAFHSEGDYKYLEWPYICLQSLDGRTIYVREYVQDGGRRE